jgi:DNA-3-methyladenine glycosylase
MNLSLTGNEPKKSSADLIAAALPQSFFARPTLKVCADLLGKKLCRRFENGDVQSHIITEVEGYIGFNDRASHGFKKTPRSQVIYGQPGHWYVYLCYGIHEMLNVVTEKADYPAAILIRGVVGYSGPGRLTKALKINRRFNTLAVLPATDLWIADSEFYIGRKDYIRTPRIGVDYAGPVWAKKPFRFLLRPEYFK